MWNNPIIQIVYEVCHIDVWIYFSAHVLDWRQCGNSLALCYLAVVMELSDSLMWMNCKSEFGVIFLRCSSPELTLFFFSEKNESSLLKMRSNIEYSCHTTGACPGGEGPGPPPLEIEKQKKKKKKKVIRANIKLVHLYFATFLVENVFFSASFWTGPPPPWKSEKQKKKKAFRFWAPPLANSWTRACTISNIKHGRWLSLQLKTNWSLTLVVRLPGAPGSPRRTRRRLPGIPGSKKKIFFFLNV